MLIIYKRNIVNIDTCIIDLTYFLKLNNINITFKPSPRE
jgi:hypothetical protein